MSVHLSRGSRINLAVLFTCGALSMAPLTNASAQETRIAQSSDLVVEGTVVNVFQSSDQHLVQILVRQSAATAIESGGRVRYPAPGESVYVHVAGDSRFGGAADQGMPRARDSIRAHLKRGDSGDWASVGDRWYEESSNSRIDMRIGSDRVRPNPLGLSTDPVSIGRTNALKVTQVVPGGVASAAGIEVGDMIVAANRRPITTEQQLNEQFGNRRGAFSLTIRDVRSGRDVDVPIGDVASRPRSTTKQPLGVTSELAFVGGEPAVKITKVVPRSPADEAGLAAGLVILKVDGNSVSSVADLDEAERRSGGRMEIEVIDPKTKRKQVLRVAL